MKNSVSPFIYYTLMLSFAFLGCAGLQSAPKPITRYAIHYSPPLFAFSQQLPALIKVERFGSSPYYASTQMIYSANRFERAAYLYHQWFALPGEMVAHALVKDLKAGNTFAAITLPGDRIPATHVLCGSVTDFYEKDDDADGRAILGISIILFTESRIDMAKEILIEKQYTAEVACRQKKAPAFAAAMNDAIQSLSEKIIHDLYEAISSQANFEHNKEE